MKNYWDFPLSKNISSPNFVHTTRSRTKPLCKMLSDSKYPQQWCAAAWMEPEYQQRGCFPVRNVLQNFVTKHRDVSTPKEQALPSRLTCPCAPVWRIQNMTELMCMYTMTIFCIFQWIWAFRLLLKPMTLTLIKLSGTPGLLLPVFWLYCLSLYLWVTLTLDIPSKDFPLSAMYEKTNNW